MDIMLNEARDMIAAKDAESGESWSDDSEAIAKLMVAFAKSYTDLILSEIIVHTANRHKYKQWEKRVVEICGGELE